MPFRAAMPSMWFAFPRIDGNILRSQICQRLRVLAKSEKRRICVRAWLDEDSMPQCLHGKEAEGITGRPRRRRAYSPVRRQPCQQKIDCRQIHCDECREELSSLLSAGEYTQYSILSTGMPTNPVQADDE